MTTEFKYLDYEGLKLFKEKLEHLRLADKTDIVEILNEISNEINDGKLSIYINGTLLNEFTANQAGNTDVNIIVPTELGDLSNSVEFIKNVIKYGQPDVSDLTNDQKESLHNQTSEESGLVSEDVLETTLTSYGTNINYDTEHQKIQLRHNNTVLSEIDAADFIKDSMIQDISVTDGTGDNAGLKVLLIDFNSESGVQDIEIPISEFFNPDNYYVKTDFADVALSGSYTDLSDTPSTLTLEEVNQGTNSDGKLVTAKIIRDSIDSAITGGNSKVITDDNLSEKVLTAGFAKSVLVGNNTPTIADVNGVLFVPEQKQTDWNENNTSDKAYIKNKPIVYNLTEIQNIVKYGQADVSELTDEEKTEAEQENGFIKNSDLAVVAKTGSYSDLLNIPTNISLFTNDSGYITNLDIKGKVDREINGSNGKALVFNESDGGGTKFEHNDGTFSFVGVNDGGSNGIAGQIYAIKKINEKNTGSRIDITKDAIYYTVGNDSISERLVPKNEIATKNDIDLKIEYISNGSITLSNYYNKTQVNNLLSELSYNNLQDLPTIPDVLIQSDWNQTDTLAKDYIKNKPTLFSGSYDDLTDKPNIPTNLSDLYNDANYLVEGDVYSKNEIDLKITESGTFDPTLYYTKNDIDNAGYLTLHLDISGKANSSDLATVATTGDYNDLDNKPTIPTVPTNVSDFTNDVGYLTQHQDISGKANTADLASVATSGSYNDLTDKPNIINNYSNLSYTTDYTLSSASGNISVDCSNNVYKIIAVDNISSISLTGVPEEGHSSHFIIKINNNNSEATTTIVLSNQYTFTLNEITYSLICPKNSDLILSGTNGEYVEFDILRLGNELFVRGI